MSADLEFYLAAVNNNSLGLEVRLPDLLGVALRKAHIVAELLAFAGNVTLLHRIALYLFYLLGSTHFDRTPSARFPSYFLVLTRK